MFSQRSFAFEQVLSFRIFAFTDWTMGAIFSVSAMVACRGNDEFYFDRFRQQWRWHYGDRWWTFEPIFDDDMEFGVFCKGGCWVSDQGHIWHGVDPEAWYRQYSWMQANRRWLREECYRFRYTAMALRRKELPAPITSCVLVLAFGHDISERTSRWGLHCVLMIHQWLLFSLQSFVCSLYQAANWWARVFFNYVSVRKLRVHLGSVAPWIYEWLWYWKQT